MIYADFKSILVPEDDGAKNANEFYSNKYQKQLLVVRTINYFVLTINLVSLLNHG